MKYDRSQILSANISLEQSPSLVIPIGNRKSSRSQNITEILGDASATDFSSIEVAADEIAECIQNVMQMNPINLRSAEGTSGDASGSGSLVFGSSVVVSFKPVTTGSVASGN
jgi:hypothetical protein